ncbi:MAG: penicillin-binding protein 2 [Parcubacteria group bacterium CG23_combo_of_CG06-09_8_20_14_all_35_9]|nr:MAG: penicillin-binding protein 2 [Parcubacteria group bacterium CG23_combo_of_CG06-09_8_20_14_all_35_9]
MSKRNKQENPFVVQEGEVKDADLHGYYKVRKAEDSWGEYIEELPKNKVLPLRVSLSGKKLNLILVLVLLGLLILLGKAGYLQIVKGDYFRQMAESNRIRTRIVKANRGIIYDREMRPLVRNIPNFSLSAIPADLPRDKNRLNKLIVQLSEIIEEPQEKIRKLIGNPSPYSFEQIPIKENIDYEQMLGLEVNLENLPGVILESGALREYLIGEKEKEKEFTSASHILGYVGKIPKEELKTYQDKGYLAADYVGITGIELIYEDALKGDDGKEQIEVDALGKKRKLISREDPMSGNNLMLTIDLELQKKSEEILREQLKKIKGTRGSVIVLNPQNGEVLSMVSLPSFNNNDFAKGISQENYKTLKDNSNKPLFFRSISGEYPLGSTIKLIIAAAALEEGIITPYTTFRSVGGIRIKEWFYPDWKSGGHGLTDIKKALAESVNTFFYIIGGGYEDFKGLGVKKIVEYAQKFGLGQISGIDLPAEKEGFLPTPEWKEKAKDEDERWYIGDTYHLSIGQGDISVTPLQVANFTSVFANGGILFKPHLAKKILNPENEIIDDISPQVVRKIFVSEKNIEIVRGGLRQAVISGSARSLADLPVNMAGKTGTAQWEKNKFPHAWFTGFAPYEEPQIVITVLIEEGGEGTYVALPVAKEILKWYFDKNTNKNE